MGEINNAHVNSIWKALNAFIENIKSLYDSFEYSEMMLRSQKLEAQKEYNAFVKPYLAVRPGDGPVLRPTPNIPNDKEKQFQHVERKLQRSQESSKLLMRSYIVSMVSQFDAFIANLMRSLYEINPDKLKQAGHMMTFADLQTFPSIEAAREFVIESKIENILRDSHQEQFKEIASTIGVQTLNKFDNWPVFVEITQRRNLFVHSNGVVSSQYLNICKSEGVDLEDISKGRQLDVDRPYFIKAFNIFYEVSVKLSQMALRVLLLKKDNSCLGEIDMCMNSSIHDLINDERYDVAIELCNFALDPQFKHSDLDRIQLLLNRAQAYKWKGDEIKCKQLLESEDTSSWRSELKCPMYALEDNIDKVCEMMVSSGKNSEILDAESYRIWPFFKSVRGDKKFKETFKQVFGEDMEFDGKNTDVVDPAPHIFDDSCEYGNNVTHKLPRTS